MGGVEEGIQIVLGTSVMSLYEGVKMRVRVDFELSLVLGLCLDAPRICIITFYFNTFCFILFRHLQMEVIMCSFGICCD